MPHGPVVDVGTSPRLRMVSESILRIFNYRLGFSFFAPVLDVILCLALRMWVVRTLPLATTI